MQYFNIQVASQLSGVASATIRAWEKRYNAVVPDRADNKHRLYSEKDIEKIALLYKLTEIGQSIGKIAHLEIEELKEIYLKLFHHPYENQISHDSDVDFDKLLTSLSLALSAYKLDILSHELEKAQSNLSPKDFALKLIVPLFSQIGQKVLRGELSITQEHTLSSLVSFYAGGMIGKHYKNSQKNDDVIIITTPEGEYHSIGILASTLLCIHHGKKVIYLGPNTPSASLSEMCRSLKVKAIVLGTLYPQGPNLVNYIDSLLFSLPNEKIKILVGGIIDKQNQNWLMKKNIPYFSSLNSFELELRNL